MATHDEDWVRLGAYVLREASDHKRVSTVLGIARETNLNPKTVRKLINGRPVRRDTLLTLERWLDWQPGSMEAVLRGEDPQRAREADMGAAERIMRQRSPVLYDQVERDLWETLATIALTYEEKLAKLHEFRSRRARPPRPPKEEDQPPDTGTNGRHRNHW